MRPSLALRKPEQPSFPALPLEIRLRLACLVGHEKPVGDGIAHGVEEARAAVDVAPALVGESLRVGADEEVALEFLVGKFAYALGPGDMRLAGMAKFEFGPLFLAIGATDEEHQIRSLTAAVAGSPVLGVPAGSMSRMCASSSATGQCSTPFGTTNSSPGPSVTSPSRMRIVSRPFSTRKKSSVSSCLCHTNSPLTFTIRMSLPLYCPTTRGCQCSENVESLSARSIAFTVRSVGFEVDRDAAPRRRRR